MNNHPSRIKPLFCALEFEVVERYCLCCWWWYQLVFFNDRTYLFFFSTWGNQLVFTIENDLVLMLVNQLILWYNSIYKHYNSENKYQYLKPSIIICFGLLWSDQPTKNCPYTQQLLLILKLQKNFIEQRKYRHKWQKFIFQEVWFVRYNVESNGFK